MIRSLMNVTSVLLNDFTFSLVGENVRTLLFLGNDENSNVSKIIESNFMYIFNFISNLIEITIIPR